MENKKDIGRFSSKNKMNIVLSLIRGESLDELARKHKIPASTISEWYEDFMEGGQANLKSLKPILVTSRSESSRKSWATLCLSTTPS
ncbi:MAG: helix-turn-helix domain containing protein [Bdellovibrionaceae bacterium]|nr:helix-turn-helix domain containing protein [Pseudobdellovibrionaceae bacterium]